MGRSPGLARRSGCPESQSALQGIGTPIVEPGAFLTDLGSGALHRAHKTDAYAATVGMRRAYLKRESGIQG